MSRSNAVSEVRPAVDLDALVALFYADRSALGELTRCTSGDCPAAYRKLLHHNNHMTVTVEQRHGCLVDVEVLEARQEEHYYLRRIVLRRQSDGRAVQFGIVRLDLNVLQPQVRDEILSQRIPLGRVLIQHNVLRRVELVALWQVGCGPDLARIFQVPVGHLTYGRTAMIYCDGQPAVELLEIVAPEDTF
ncbi:MAG: hypothetical protein D6753_14005 [Planctomycetota bacterium]|nr:MAG: hypothetical protein D6753_14005 [Planctomycetota bacterium]